MSWQAQRLFASEEGLCSAKLIGYVSALLSARAHTLPPNTTVILAYREAVQHTAITELDHISTEQTELTLKRACRCMHRIKGSAPHLLVLAIHFEVKIFRLHPPVALATRIRMNCSRPDSPVASNLKWSVSDPVLLLYERLTLELMVPNPILSLCCLPNFKRSDSDPIHLSYWPLTLDWRVSGTTAWTLQPERNSWILHSAVQGTNVWAIYGITCSCYSRGKNRLINR
jgi:hypothetical protein